LNRHEPVLAEAAIELLAYDLSLCFALHFLAKDLKLAVVHREVPYCDIFYGPL
jgi:hypothetical protein